MIREALLRVANDNDICTDLGGFRVPKWFFETKGRANMCTKFKVLGFLCVVHILELQMAPLPISPFLVQSVMDGWNSLDTDGPFYAEFDAELGRRFAHLSNWNGHPSSLDATGVVKYMLIDCGIDVCDYLCHPPLAVLMISTRSMSHIQRISCQARRILLSPRTRLGVLKSGVTKNLLRSKRASM